jgi:hypothetical protein
MQLAKSSMLPEPKPIPILNETQQLIRIFFSTVRTAERNSKRRFECEHVPWGLDVGRCELSFLNVPFALHA